MKRKNILLLTSLLLTQTAPAWAMFQEENEVAIEKIAPSTQRDMQHTKSQSIKPSTNRKFDFEHIISLTKPLKSFELKKENLKNLEKIDAIVLIGSSGAGKTTLLQEIREKCRDISIPKRFITRPMRLNEDDKENIHLDKKLFEQNVKEGKISCSWSRKLGEDRQEYYGFESTDGNFPIYSANNSFLYSETMSNSSNYLVVALYAPQETRRERLATRSPDFSLEELKVRVEDPYEDAMSKAHVLVHNYGEFEEKTSKFDLVTFVNTLKLIKAGWGQIKDLNNHAIEYHTRLFDIMTHEVEFSDGNRKTFQYARRSPGVRTLISQNNKLLINAEWRTEINGWDFRLPGGKVFEDSAAYSSFLTKFGKEKLQEKGKEAAAAEIQEECGIVLKDDQLKYLGTSKCGATVDWDLFYYFAEFSGNTEVFANTSPEGERTLSLWLSHDDVLDLCLNGSISEDRTAALLMRLILNSKKGGTNE